MSVAKGTPISLETFDAGEVLCVVRPDLARDPATIQQVREWLAAGLLTSPDDKPDPVMSLLYSHRPGAVRPLPEDYTPFVDVGSWPWRCGRFARWADGKNGTKTKCPVVGDVRDRWMAGYNGQPEPKARA
jgi:hypothetical protein